MKLDFFGIQKDPQLMVNGKVHGRPWVNHMKPQLRCYESTESTRLAVRRTRRPLDTENDFVKAGEPSSPLPELFQRRQSQRVTSLGTNGPTIS